jgi:hypothetical protein
VVVFHLDCFFNGVAGCAILSPLNAQISFDVGASIVGAMLR